jgi:hypothetical protein
LFPALPEYYLSTSSCVCHNPTFPSVPIRPEVDSWTKLGQWGALSTTPRQWSLFLWVGLVKVGL